MNRRLLQLARRLAPIVLCCTALSELPSGADGYTGGPVRAFVEGFEPSENKLFYSLWYQDETDAAPEIYYFDLASSEPTKPIRASSLEMPAGKPWAGVLPQPWEELRRRLVGLHGAREFELQERVQADSVGYDNRFKVVAFRLHVELQSGSDQQSVRLDSFCDPLVRVRGLYRVPGRPELLAVVSHIGRAYGCEEVDVPVLLVASPTR